ncbi:monooxygenase [Herbidospora sp. NEAU-GS84]|uniref:Monooxygenase n=1 Tax=Herbidospora solisilvae TaxID=2696284 RepID=A0A7C9NAW5_9ACTN|nr:NAD(P)/FAD-dependent oxidoreductase [Herbidospora solisilvae]NAS26133.1 monooxygenase [Herbidospora solisilvae]
MIDLLIAGGGPAGLATACHAALAGMEAVVVEPRATPVDKACGEGLMPTGAEVLRALGVRPEGWPLRGITYLDAGGSVTAPFPRGLSGLGVRRTILHEALAKRAAELGVRVVAGRVERFRQRPDDVEADGFGRARWLVAADGLHSPLRAALGLTVPPGRLRRHGLRRHFAVAPWNSHVEVHWSPGAEAYVTPLGAELVGVAVLSSRRVPYEEHLAAFPALRDRLGPACSPVRGAGPLRQGAKARVAGRVLLVGDAAGYVDALTGEGVSLAARSAEALVAALRTGDPGSYERAWRRLSRRHRALTAALVGVRGTPMAGDLIAPAARKLPWAFRAAVALLA